MKYIVRIYWIFKNFLGLLKGLSRYDHFDWENNACKAINSSIDDSVAIYGSYRLNNVSIGYSTYVSTNALMANTTIGKFCSIGPNVVSGMGIHPVNGISTHPAFYSKKAKSKFTLSNIDIVKEHLPVEIGNDVFIGANVTILDGVKIGDGAVIGAGAVVNKDIPPYAIAVGCPIKVVKYRFAPEIVESLLKSQWWDSDKLIKSVHSDFFDIENFLYRSKVSNSNFQH